MTSSKIEKKENERKEKIVLPEIWKEMLRIIESVSIETGIPYAIIGSLGVAATCGIAWTPKNYIAGQEVDLDIFVMGNEKQKELFHLEITKKIKSGMPKIDSKMFFGSHIIFEEEKVFVRHKKLNLEIDKKTFKTTNFEVDGVTFPVINPQTHLMMNKAYNRKYPVKIQIRVDALIKLIKNGSPKFDLINEDELKPLVQLKRSLESNYYMRQAKKRVTELKSNNLAARAIDGIHKNFPRAWEILRNLTQK